MQLFKPEDVRFMGFLSLLAASLFILDAFMRKPPGGPDCT
jgi:hypothetical protein